jgi:hypothetical protein
MKTRNATLGDIKEIQEIDKDYYDGSMTPIEILKDWIKTFSEGFFVIEIKGEIVAYIFLEPINKFQPIDFIHFAKDVYKPNGRYVNISGLGVLNKYKGILDEKLMKLVEDFSKKRKCKQILFIIGEAEGIGKHDTYERKLAGLSNFLKKENVPKWKVADNYYVSDHWVWVKDVK